MLRSKHLAVILAVFLLAMVTPMSFAQNPTPSPQEETAKLADVLKSNAPEFDKAMACRRLAVVGGKDAVPALAGLLGDAKLSSYARSALENIPDPAADAALREAIGKLEGERLIGVLDSIGRRRDPQAVDAVAKVLASPDRAVASAAARSLGKIASLMAGSRLADALRDAPKESKAAVAEACLTCAGHFAEEGHRDMALSLYARIRTSDVPRHLVLAATHREIVTGGQEKLSVLDEELQALDEAGFRFALQAARDLGPAATGTLVARFDKEPVPHQALLILALVDLGDRAALPLILKSAERGAKEVRIEALHALGRLGDGSAVPVLLAAAVDQDADVAQPARAALAQLKSDEIDTAIALILEGDNVASLQMAAAIAGERAIMRASPALFKLTGHADSAVRLAAIKSLGATADLDELPKLIALALAPAGETQAAAAQSLKAACARLPRDAAAEKLAAAMSGTSVPARVTLLEQLAAVGGPKALGEMIAAARSPEEPLQDAATRLLGAWMSTDAAPPLLDLAKTLADEKYRTRALRGYLRIGRQLNMTQDERLEVCRNALAAARRNEEKVLAVETLGRIGSPAGLAMAVSYLGDKDLKEPACGAIVAMSDAVALTAPEEIEKALARVMEVTTQPAVKQRAEKQIARAKELAQQRREEPEFVPIFDGQTLAGWEGDSTVFRVEDGAIVGGSLKKAIGRGNDFLCTKKAYGNFELRLQFKLVGQEPNGGMNLRSKRNADDGVAGGYQADLGAGYWGALYDEARRNRVLAAASPKPEIREDAWNDYRIRCEGRRIRLWVNGVQTVDYTEPDANIPAAGILAVQVQANRPSEAWYRDLRIREIKPD